MVNIDIIQKDLKKLRRSLKLFAKTRGSYHYDTLECMCGISSLIIYRYLKGYGLRPVFHMNDIHCFVTCRLDRKKYFIDLTLKQFSRKFPAVYCKPIAANKIPHWTDYNNPHFSKKSAMTEVKIKKMFQRNWPAQQNPFKLHNIPSI